MLTQMKSSRVGVGSLLSDPRLRQVVHNGQTLYTAVDVVGLLIDSQHPAELWSDLKSHHPALGERLVSTAESGEDLLDLEGIFWLIQSVESPRAERLKHWLAETGRQRM